MLALCCGETHVFEVIDCLRMFCDFEENVFRFLCLLLEGKERLSCLHGLEASRFSELFVCLFFFSALSLLQRKPSITMTGNFFV